MVIVIMSLLILVLDLTFALIELTKSFKELVSSSSKNKITGKSAALHPLDHEAENLKTTKRLHHLSRPVN